jgi:hypothetical protein
MRWQSLVAGIVHVFTNGLGIWSEMNSRRLRACYQE